MSLPGQFRLKQQGKGGRQVAQLPLSRCPDLQSSRGLGELPGLSPYTPPHILAVLPLDICGINLSHPRFPSRPSLCQELEEKIKMENVVKSVSLREMLHGQHANFQLYASCRIYFSSKINRCLKYAICTYLLQYIQLSHKNKNLGWKIRTTLFCCCSHLRDLVLLVLVQILSTIGQKVFGPSMLCITITNKKTQKTRPPPSIMQVELNSASQTHSFRYAYPSFASAEGECIGLTFESRSMMTNDTAKQLLKC